MEKLFLILAGFISVFAQITLKFGMKKIGVIDLAKNGLFVTIFTIFLNPVVLLGLFCFFISSFLWLVALSKLELSFAYPVVISISYTLIPLLSIFLFKERLSATQWVLLGVIFVCLLLFYYSE